MLCAVCCFVRPKILTDLSEVRTALSHDHEKDGGEAFFEDVTLCRIPLGDSGFRLRCSASFACLSLH